MKEKLDRFNEHSKIVEELALRVIEPYVRAMDDLVEDYDSTVMDKNRTPTDQELDYFILNFPAVMYYAYEGLEIMGLKEDVAEAARKERFNLVFAEVKGTIPEKTAKAELDVQKENIIKLAHNRAYRLLDGKIDAAQECLKSAKKIYTKRTIELEITRMGGNDESR